MEANKSLGIEFLNGITILLVFQLLGEISVRLCALPIPGPVVGLLYLLIFILILAKFKRQTPHSLEYASGVLLNHLSLLFVPAGVGVMVHFQRLHEEWMAIVIALFVGVLVTIATTALSMKFFLSLQSNNDSKNS